MESPDRRDIPRTEGLDKLRGSERYVDDIVLPDCLWGMTVRSPAPLGRIREIRFGDGVDWSDVVVVDASDIPGPNFVKLYTEDQPVLADGVVRHLHESVLLLAHPDRQTVRRAVREVEVVVDEEEGLLDFLAAPEPEQIQYGDDNVFKHIRIDKGDVEAALARAAHVVEGTYRTGAQEHVYIENQGMLAHVEDGVVVVQGSMQCPYYVHEALKSALDRDDDGVRVIWSPTGGAFGGKEEYPSTIALHTALLALKAGRPVKMVYDRGEDMAATTKRHPSWVRHRTGLDGDGRLVAQEIEVAIDGGAYCTLSPVVLSRAVLHAAGPYHCDSVRIDGRAVLTNTVPKGAFRGFGAPQTQFAVERHMDVIAHRLGIDPVELRRTNLIRDGQTTATGQTIEDGTDRVALMELALEEADYERRREEHRAFNAGHPYLRRGIGFSTFFHGAGFTGSGETHLASRVRVAGLPDGRVEVRTAQTEMGQGTTTAFTQIAAGRLGYDPDDVVIAVPDTGRVPNSGPTVASRTVMVVGRLVEEACDALKHEVGLTDEAGGVELKHAIRSWYREQPRRPGDARAEGEDAQDAHAGEVEGEPDELADAPELVAEVGYREPPGIRWDESTYRGDAYATYAWATQVAEVEVDLRVFDTRVTDFVSVQEVGRVINEVLATGQIQGGVVQGIGYALMEDCKFDGRGDMRNNQLTNYIIATSDDVPPIRVVFLENPYRHGAQGAKGLGELPIDGAAPAVINAVAAALGVEPDEIPLTPERMMALLDSDAAAGGAAAAGGGTAAGGGAAAGGGG